MTRTRSARARRASHSRPRPPSGRGKARRPCCRGPFSTRPPRGSKGGVAMRTGPNQTTQIAGLRPGPQPAGTSPGTPRDSGLAASGPHGAGVHGGGSQHGARGCPAGALAAPCSLSGCAARPTRRDTHTNGASHGGAAVRHRGGAAGGRRAKLCPPPWPGADHGQVQGPQRDAFDPWRATLHERTRIRDTAEHPLSDPSRGGHW